MKSLGHPRKTVRESLVNASIEGTDCVEGVEALSGDTDPDGDGISTGF
jgi:hypothetical protein